MSKKTKDPDTFDPEYVKKTRTFPLSKTIFLALCIIAQIACILFAVSYNPQPQDVIKNYNLIITPKDDGSLDIEYSLVWNALDTEEELTWVEIGMANSNYTVYQDSLSSNIATYTYHTNEDYVGLRLDFKNPYIGGDKFGFSFKINQKH